MYRLQQRVPNPNHGQDLGLGIQDNLLTSRGGQSNSSHQKRFFIRNLSFNKGNSQGRNSSSHPNGAFDFLASLQTCQHPSRLPRLYSFLPIWESITSDRWVLNIIREGYVIEFEANPPQLFCRTHSTESLLDEVSILLKKQTRTAGGRGPRVLLEVLYGPEDPSSHSRSQRPE